MTNSSSSGAGPLAEALSSLLRLSLSRCMVAWMRAIAMATMSFKHRLYAVACCAILAAFGASGCSGNAKGGLANAPNINRPWDNNDRGRDVIANGPEACGPTRERPERSKLPQCQETLPVKGPLAPLSNPKK